MIEKVAPEESSFKACCAGDAPRSNVLVEVIVVLESAVEVCDVGDIPFSNWVLMFCSNHLQVVDGILLVVAIRFVVTYDLFGVDMLFDNLS